MRRIKYRNMNKQIYDNTLNWQFTTSDGSLVAAYLSNSEIDEASILQGLQEIPFTRVKYISKYQKANRTPRLTWSYGRVGPNDKPVTYRGLTYESEDMPDWLESLSRHCREIAKLNWGFDPEYNSCIIGKYTDGDDSIGFHFDTESFLTHHFCANVTIGTARDFHFKTPTAEGGYILNEICLDHKSIFFFLGLEHALPKRAAIKEGQVRYSISFRNMSNMVGIGNSFYYCRGLDGAVDNYEKELYIKKLAALESQKTQSIN